MEYIYRHTTLSPVEKQFSDSREVAEDTLICYDVQPHVPGPMAFVIKGSHAKAWTFSVRGMKGRFITHYDWSLVRNTPDNLDKLRRIRQLQAQRAHVLRQIEAESKLLNTAAKDLMREAK